jgi:hypothetical protein
MKSMTRKQLADRAGVTTQTFKNWLEPHLDQLHAMGMPTGKGAIPPNVIDYLIKTFNIEE